MIGSGEIQGAMTAIGVQQAAASGIGLTLWTR